MKILLISTILSFLSVNSFAQNKAIPECRIYEYCGDGGSPDQPVCQYYLPIECSNISGNENTIFMSGVFLKQNHSLSHEYKFSIRYNKYEEYQILIDRTLKHPSMLWLKNGDDIKSLHLKCEVDNIKNFVCSISDKKENAFNQDFISVWYYP